MPCYSPLTNRLRMCARHDLWRSAALALALFPALPARGDIEPPNLVIDPPSVSITNAGPVDFWVIYTDNTAVQEITITESDVTLHTTGTADADISVEIAGLTAVRVRLSNITGDGALAFSIAPGTATDGAGNPATGAGPSQEITIDNTAPVGAFGTPSPLLLGGFTYEVEFPWSFSDANPLSQNLASVNIHTSGSVSLGSSSGYWDGVSSGYYRPMVNSSGSGELAISLPAGWVTDAAGNASLPVGPSPTVIVDYNGPVFSDITVTPALAAAGTTVSIGFTSSEPLTLDGPNSTVVRLSRDYCCGIDAALESTGPLNRYNFQYVVPPFASSGMYDVEIYGLDLAGNYGSSYTEDQLEIDTMPPYFYNFAATPYYAGLGQQVTITFDCFDELSLHPLVITDGDEASFVSKVGATYTYSYTVGEESQEHSRSVTVSGYDPAGNYGSTSSGSTLFSVDRTPPTFQAGSIYPYCGANMWPAYIPLTVDDYVPGAVTLWIGDELATPEYASSPNFNFSYKPSLSVADGPKECVAVGSDWYGNLGVTTFTALLTVDNSAPMTTVTVEDSTLVGNQVFKINWIASDGAGSGLSSTTLYVREPGGSEYLQFFHEETETSGTIEFSPWAGPGRYEFYSLASDWVQNHEMVPASPEAVVIVNTNEGSPFTVDVPIGDSEFVFPLSDDFDCTITLVGVTSPGMLSVSRISPLPAGTEPGYFRKPSDLLREALVITGTGGLLTGDFTAILEWTFDPALTPGNGIDRVYRFEGSLDSPTGIYTVSPIGGSGKLRVTGIDGFSTWYAGNSAAVPVTVSGFAVE